MKTSKKLLSFVAICLALLTLMAVISSCKKKEQEKTYGMGKNKTSQSETDPNLSYNNQDTYVITFVNWDDTVLYKIEVKAGETPEYRMPEPKKADEDEYGFRFVGWNEALSAAKGDTTYIATYEPYLLYEPWRGMLADSFAGGSGSAYDPYQIANGEQLAYLAKLVNEGQEEYSGSNVHYVLTENINLGDTEWTSIGCGVDLSGNEAEQYQFNGSFDGAGYTIFNLRNGTLYRGYYTAAGLFGVVGGSVRDLNLRKAGVSVNGCDLGIVCGRLTGTGDITECAVSGSVLGGTMSLGGVCGKSWGRIADCSAEIKVLGINQNVSVGGLCGTVESQGVVERCKVSGSVEANSDNTQNSWVGGLVGQALREGTFTECVVEAQIKATSVAGGLIGYANRPNIRHCESRGSIYVSFLDQYAGTTHNAGGLIGECYNGSVMYSVAHTDISVKSTSETRENAYFGGLIGFLAMQQGDTLQYCGATGNIETDDTYIVYGKMYASGFIGKANPLENIQISDCYTTGNVTAGHYASGFIGYTTNLNGVVLQRCYVAGNITATVSTDRDRNIPNAIGFYDYPEYWSKPNFVLESCLLYGNVSAGTGVATTGHANYRAEYQTTSKGQGGGIYDGIGVLERDLNTDDFYRNTLGFGEEWDLSELDVRNGKFPKFQFES